MKFAGITPSGLCVASTVAAADPVVLANGDRLSGTLDRMEAGSLGFDTTYAGPLKLPWAQLRPIEPDAPVRLRRVDGTELDGRLEDEQGAGGAAGRDRIRAGDSTHALPVALARVGAINPPHAPDTTTVNGRASLGGSVTQGHTESQTLRLAGEVLARNPAHRVTLGADANVTGRRGGRVQLAPGHEMPIS